MGTPNFGEPQGPKIYDTRLNGETLFSDFRWCHGELLLGTHGAAIAAMVLPVDSSLSTDMHHHQNNVPACLKECFYKQYAVGSTAAGMHTLLNPRINITLATFVFEEVPRLRPTDGCGVITCT